MSFKAKLSILIVHWMEQLFPVIGLTEVLYIWQACDYQQKTSLISSSMKTNQLSDYINRYSADLNHSIVKGLPLDLKFLVLTSVRLDFPKLIIPLRTVVSQQLQQKLKANMIARSVSDLSFICWSSSFHNSLSAKEINHWNYTDTQIVITRQQLYQWSFP